MRFPLRRSEAKQALRDTRPMRHTVRAWSVGTALLVVLLLPLYCDASFRFTDSAEECTAVGEDSLVVVVRTESGTAQSFFGPCPKTRSTVDEITFYTLTYKLSRPQDRPAKSASLRFAAKDVQRLAEGKSNPVEEILNKRAGVPPAANLYARLNKKILDLEGKIPANDEVTLKRLGFNTTRAVFAADLADGRWYMGFTPCEKGVQICCPGKALLLEKDLKCDYGSIWDPEQSRVVFITSDPTSAPIVGFPQAVTAWDYAHGTLTTYKPWQPPASDFR